MKDLSALEAALLLSIIEAPGRTLTVYTDMCMSSYTQISRAVTRLKSLMYVRCNEDNRFYISDEFMKKEQAEVAQTYGLPEPEQSTQEVEPMVDRKQELIEEAMKPKNNDDLPPRSGVGVITEESIMYYMNDGQRRTASWIAGKLGHTDGRSVARPLRALCQSGQLIKIDSFYELANPGEAFKRAAVKPIPVTPEPAPVAEPESKHISDSDIADFIRSQTDSFTAKSCYEDLCKDHECDYNAFMNVFDDVVQSDDVICYDDGQFVDPTADYNPEALYMIRVVGLEPDQIRARVSEFVERNNRFSLLAVVMELRLAPKTIISVLKELDYNLSNLANISKGKHLGRFQHSPKQPHKTENFQHHKPSSFPTQEYKQIEELDSKDIVDFISTGVRFSAFMKKFQLNLSDRKKILDALTLTKLAEFDAETQWLFPPRAEEKQVVEIELPADHLLSDELSKELVACIEEEEQKQIEIAERDASEVVGLENVNSMSVDPAIVEQLKQGLEDGTLTLSAPPAPIGTPPHVWTEGEEEKLVEALHEIAVAENRLTTAQDLDPSLPDNDRVDDGFVRVGEHPEVSKEFGEKLAELAEVLAASESTELPELVIMSSDMAEELGIDVEALPRENEQGELIEEYRSGRSEEPVRVQRPRVYAESEKAVLSELPVPVVKPSWIVTLQMMEERLRFEHQGMAAEQLKEIREYLEPK